MIKRAEIRKHLRIAQQLKVGTLALVSILLLAAYPVYLFTRSVSQDPVFDELNALSLPDWATIEHADAISGSRWCIGQCRSRERTWASAKLTDETNAAYVTALTDAGWRPRAGGPCPQATEGVATCWRRDEYYMDMWVREPICDLPPPRPTITTKPPKSTPKSTASAEPTAAPEPTPDLMRCPGSLVTVHVVNSIDYQPTS